MYEIDDRNTINKIDDEGERKLLSNFTATIDKETRYDDGQNTNTILTISGKQNEKDKLVAVEVPAEKFASLAWVMPAWGVRAVIQPGQSVKDDLRTAIQLTSKPIIETVYTHTGWTKINGEYKYLHSRGAIGKEGNDPSLRVLLPPELRRFALDMDRNPVDSIRTTLRMLHLGPAKIMWPILATTIAPLHGPLDFAVHLTGRTGTFKSEIASIAQSHYGSEMDARNLPGSWSSTANALEAQTYRAKNAVFCVDDFIPTGTSWQVRSYQKTADQLLRGQGNQTGRARLTDTSNLQTTMYPRGIILSTGEDTPDGHSIRARMFILEVAPGDISTTELSTMQSMREKLPTTIAVYAMTLAQNLKVQQKSIEENARRQRDGFVDVGHSRTPSTLGRLIASVEHFLEFCQMKNAITQEQRKKLSLEAQKALVEVADEQSQYLTEADPCEAFCESLRHMLAAHLGHLRTKDGGIPASPEQVGWTEEASKGDLPTYKSHGKCLGWMSWDEDDLFIDTTAAYADIRRHAAGQITFTKQTMFKRLKDAGLLTRVDENRQRNTIRVNCEQHARQVLAMPLSQVLENTEKPNANQ